MLFINQDKTLFVVHKPRLFVNVRSHSDPYLWWSTKMSRDRFLPILQFLHLANNKDRAYDPRDPERERLFKIRPPIRKVTNHMRRVYAPGKDHCVDESLLLFKERLLVKQRTRTKRAQFGIKFYEQCTAEGITLDWCKCFIQERTYYRIMKIRSIKCFLLNVFP